MSTDNLINTLVNFYKNIKNQDELEIRFGKFKENSKFSPSISFEEYTEIKEFLKSFIQDDIVEYSFIVCHKEGERVTQILDPPVDTDLFPYPWKNNKIINDKIILKKPKKNINFNDLNLRVSLSEETTVKKIDNVFSKENHPVFCKIRKRTTFFYSFFKFDMSIIQSSNSINSLETEEITYDFEIELIDQLQDKTTDDIKNELKFVIEQFLKIFSNANKFLYKKNILKKYHELVKKSYFVGCKPETINSSKYDETEEYAMTLKLDGTRNFIFIEDNVMFLINNKLEISVYKENVLGLNGTLIDTEVTGQYINCFDILFYNNKDIREYDLNKRLLHLSEALQIINLPTVKPKEYIFNNIFSTICEYLDKNQKLTSLDIDGFILVQVKNPYPFKKQDINPLKWKPEYLNTIDFKIKKHKTKGKLEKWDLLCYNSEGCDIQFHYNNNKTIGTIKIDKTEASVYKDGDIVECKYNTELKSFVPYRSRSDKIQGNYIKVAQDIYKTILNPFDINWLKPKRENSEFFDMRRFHNWIKRKILFEYSSSNGNLLDLACGKGGDIYKWVDNNIRYIEGYDVDTESIKNAIQRYEKVITKPTSKNFNYKFIEKDLSKETIETSVEFDLASCFFAIHYFFENKNKLTNFIKNLKNIKNGGYFTVTTLCSEKLKDINYSLDCSDINIKNYIKNDNEEQIGDSISVYIKDSVLDQERKEFIVEYNYFINFMKDNGFTLMETKLFKEYYNEWTENNNSMNKVEKTYSFLNRMYVFIKNKN